MGVEHRGTLGTQAGRIGGVLLIGAAEYPAVVETHCRAYVEIGIWCIGTFYGRNGSLGKRPVSGFEFIEGEEFLVFDFQKLICHNRFMFLNFALLQKLTNI